MALEGRGLGRNTEPIKAEREFEMEGKMAKTPFLRAKVKDGDGEHRENTGFVHLDLGSSELRYEKWLL